MKTYDFLTEIGASPQQESHFVCNLLGSPNMETNCKKNGIKRNRRDTQAINFFNHFL